MAIITAVVVAASASYTVAPGDTLSGIAARFGVRTADLAAANSISNPNLIFAGQRLTVPGSGGGSAAPGAHVVAHGETLSGIAVKYGVSVRSLTDANGLSDPNHIRAGQRLTIPGSRPGSGVSRSAGAARTSPGATRAEVGALIERVSRQHGWNPAFVKALAWQESGWNNGTVSSAGARGIMQIMPGTGDFISDNLAGRRLDLADPADNVLAGVLFLQHLWELTGGDARMTLAGYYQGLASVRRNGVYDSTERYIDNVMALRGRF